MDPVTATMATAATAGFDLNGLMNGLVEQSVTAAVLFVVLILFARWVKTQIAYEREDKNRCFDMHEALRTCIDNNTSATADNAKAVQNLSNTLATHFPSRQGRNGGS